MALCIITSVRHILRYKDIEQKSVEIIMWPQSHKILMIRISDSYHFYSDMTFTCLKLKKKHLVDKI